ncbi:MAG: hypothetical protein P1U89_26150 [Verrucomicrobiales bacterium]|nr:hypothetical protein [Verrucomicrobiales bacterium]
MGAIRQTTFPEWFRHLGVIPFLLILPFQYLPKIHPGDTQPWVLIVGILCYFLWNFNFKISVGGASFAILAPLIVLVLLLDTREGVFFRELYFLVSLFVFWELATRDRGEILHIGLKWTLSLYLIIALIQTASVKLGFHFPISGRFLASRGGVPSLACEPAMLATIGALITMYLLDRGDSIAWAIMGIILILLSGSLSGMAFMVFPLMHKRLRKGLWLIVPAVVILLVVSSLTEGLSLTNRLGHLLDRGLSVNTLLSDVSTNMRTGHVVYQIQNLWQNLFFGENRPFYQVYKEFANESNHFIDTGSFAILSFGGEMFFYLGWIGLLLILLVLFFSGIGRKNVGIIHYGFLVSLLMNPVSFALPYFVIYLVGIKKDWACAE